MATTMMSVNDENRWKDMDSEQKFMSGNHIRSKPAKDSVITGILSSLDSMDPTRKSHTVFTPPRTERGTSPGATRPFTSESFASPPNVPFSPHNGTRLEDSSDDDFEDDIASPPVISTTRSPGRLSNLRSTSYGADITPPRVASLNTTPKERLYSKKLSSESWVKGSQEAEPMRKQIRRISSHDTLRQAEPDKDFQVDQDFIFNGLGSLGVTPQPEFRQTPDIPRRQSPKLLGKGRLYIGDSTEHMYADSIEVESIRSRRSSVGPSTPAVRKTRQTAKPSPIDASIPLRTSSLRQSSSPASSKRRARAPIRSKNGDNSLHRTISEDTADSRWADLGEDDETVKRIRELRKKRETRMLDEDATASVIASLREQSPTPPGRPTTSYSDAVPVKASKVLGMISGNDYHSNVKTGVGQEHLLSSDHQATYAPQKSLRSPSPPPHARPTTSKSTVSVTAPLSLDYSYLDAVNALQGAEREFNRPNGMTSVAARPTHLHRRTASSTSNNASPARPKRTKSKWGHDHDNRRRSMDDARDDGAERRDSVEDAVEAYLRSPRLSQRVAHPHSGRMISFSEVGDPNGAAVIVCLGMGLTKYTSCFYDELATTLRLRLITLERPGVGGSQPLPNNDRSGPLMWPGDVTTVCDHLGIRNFSILAHSAGAIYAMATALILPNRIRGIIHLLGPAVPPSQTQGTNNEDMATVAGLPRGQRFLRVLPTPFLKAANSSFMSAASASLKPVKRKSNGSPYGTIARANSESPNRGGASRPLTAGERPENARRESLMLMDRVMPDTIESKNDDEELKLKSTAGPMDVDLEYAAAALSAAEHSNRAKQSEFNSRLIEKTWEYAIKDSNPANDLMVCLERNREIGFRYSDVTRRVIMTHGAQDKRVPVALVKSVCEQMNRAALQRQVESRDALPNDPGAMPGCELRVLPDQGHGLMASGSIIGDVLTEIAGYWTAEERGRSKS